MAFYEAAVGDLDLPARKGHSENRSIAAVQFTARSKPAIKSTATDFADLNFGSAAKKPAKVAALHASTINIYW